MRSKFNARSLWAKRFERYVPCSTPKPPILIYIQENGVSTAIEAIYRDLEYARSLTIKRRNNAGLPHDEGHDTENATIRKLSSPFSSVPQTPERPSTRSSLGSATGAASEDWSVISDQEEQNLSPSKRNTAEPTSPPAKRRSLIAVLSALPESFSPSSSPPRV